MHCKLQFASNTNNNRFAEVTKPLLGCHCSGSLKPLAQQGCHSKAPLSSQSVCPEQCIGIVGAASMARSLDNLQRQLDELEALKAMYPEEEGCFVLAAAEQEALDNAAKAAAAAAATADPSAPDPPLLASLSGTVRLPGVLLEQQPVSLRFQLPPGYPTAEPPQLSLECTASRLVHEELNTVLAQTAQEAVGSESLLLVLGALQDAVEQVCQRTEAPATGMPQLPAPSAAQQPTPGQSCVNDLCRVVLWFHHIKSLTKRKHIVEWARELGCSGFCKPGFPGIIIAEGKVADVQEYVSRLRALQWQAMQVRAEQLVPCAECRSNDTSSHAVGFGDWKFLELPETGLSVLGSECRAAGLEGLFLAALKLQK